MKFVLFFTQMIADKICPGKIFLTLLIMFWNLLNFQPDSITVNQDIANKTTILALLDLGSLFDVHVFDHIIRIHRTL